jgi:hypothetical protein
MTESDHPTEDSSEAASERPTEEIGLDAAIEENAKLRAELEQAKAESAKHRRDRWRRVRSISVGLMVFLAILCLVVGAVGVWVQQTVFNTDRYVALVGPMASDPQVQEALATYTTDQIFNALDLQTRLEDALPGPLDVVVGPVTNAARNYVNDAARTFFASQQFQDLWVQINTVAHEKVVALLKGNYDQLPNVTITGGEVRLNTIPVITEVLRQLAQSAAGLVGLNVTIPQISANEIPEAAKEKLSQALGISLPEDFGQITIMQQSKLNQVQNAIKWFDRLLYALIGLAVILIVLAIVFSLHRRRTLIELGIGLAVGLLVFRGLTRLIEKQAVDAVTNPEARGAVKSIVGDVVANLRGAGSWLLLGGIVVAIVAYLAGRPSWFMRLLGWARRVVAARPTGSELERWVAAHADPLRWGGAVIAALILFFTGIDWLPVILVGVLLALYMWAIAVLQQRARAAAVSDDGPDSPPGGTEGGGSVVASTPT